MTQTTRDLLSVYFRFATEVCPSNGQECPYEETIQVTYETTKKCMHDDNLNNLGFHDYSAQYFVNSNKVVCQF